MGLREEHELQYLLWLERNNKVTYDLTIKCDEIINKYTIQELKELKKILEQYKDKQIEVDLRKVKAKENK